ncbi:MAG: hypothetical protein FJ295_21795 [Planctomycetes bacterium]|nr:hypothetical protein [Planctomycetota bacterium]
MLRTAAWLLIVIGFGRFVLATDPDRAPLFTRQARFPIPFHLERGDIAEVQLFVSEDRGQTWQLAAREPPSAGQFLFRAPRAGIYSFATRTMDDSGQLHPRDQLSAELQVVVDTTLPRLSFDARLLAGGNLLLSWEAQDDQQLAAHPIRIEYQANPNEPWQTVDAVANPATDAGERPEGNRASGSATWQPTTPARMLQIRAVAFDRAGNNAVSIKRVVLPPLSARYSRPSAPTVPDAIAARGATPGLGAPPAANNAVPWNGPPATPEAGATPFPPNHLRDNARPRGSFPDSTSTTNAPPLNAYRIDALPSTVRPPVADHVAAGGSSMPADPQSNTTRNSTGRPPGSWNSRSGEATFANRFASGSDPNRQAAPEAGASLPSIDDSSVPPARTAPSRPRMVSDRHFSVEYSVESHGPGGLEAVELWMTRDGGTRWEKYGTDDDLTSPFPVQVADDGYYGFRIVIFSRSGLASPAPKPGEPADIMIGVDTVRPIAKIASVSLGEGARAGQLDIRWQANDARLAREPILLQYSDSMYGPWSDLAERMPNVGQYYWTVDWKVPKNVYLKLTVEDDAGNTAEHTLSEPLNLQALTPAAHIRSVRPTSE